MGVAVDFYQPTIVALRDEGIYALFKQNFSESFTVNV